MRKILERIISPCILFFFSVSPYAQELLTPPPACQNAEKIFLNANFITLNANEPEAEAIAVTKSRIMALGKKEQILSQCKGADTELINLEKATVAPGFINTYSHLILFGWLANHALDLSTTNPFQRPNWQPIKTLEAFLAAIDANKDTEKPWLIISGYDAARLQGKALTQKDLDDISNKKPIIVFYASGQKAMLNQAAIHILETDIAFEGLQIAYDGTIQGDSINLFLEHTINDLDLNQAINTASLLYAHNGYTTVTEVQGISAWKSTLNSITQAQSFPLDLIYAKRLSKNSSSAKQKRIKNPRVYPGPMFISVDGLAQNYEAFLSEPYFKPLPEYGKTWRGSLTRPAQEIQQIIKIAIDKNMPLGLEVNGDAAIDFSLGALKKSLNTPIILFNMEYIKKEQLLMMHELGLQTNWFAPFLYYWGESMCQERLGPSRSMNINPFHSEQTISNNLSAYANAPMVSPSALDAMSWMATRIVQRWNYPVNPTCPQYFNIEERISPELALKAFTINAAKLYGLEREKGSLEVGKLADMVILSSNPLNSKGKQPLVIGTISRGVLFEYHPEKIQENNSKIPAIDLSPNDN